MNLNINYLWNTNGKRYARLITTNTNYHRVVGIKNKKQNIASHKELREIGKFFLFPKHPVSEK